MTMLLPITYNRDVATVKTDAIDADDDGILCRSSLCSTPDPPHNKPIASVFISMEANTSTTLYCLLTCAIVTCGHLLAEFVKGV